MGHYLGAAIDYSTLQDAPAGYPDGYSLYTSQGYVIVSQGKLVPYAQYQAWLASQFAAGGGGQQPPPSLFAPPISPTVTAPPLSTPLPNSVLTDPSDLDPSVLANSYIPIYGPDTGATVAPGSTISSGLGSWVLPAAALGYLVVSGKGKRILAAIKGIGKPKREPPTITIPAEVHDA